MGPPGGTLRWDPPVGPAVARHRADRPNREPAPAAHRRSHPWFLPVKTEPANDSGARPHPAPNPKPGAPRRAFLPPPNGAADPGSGAPFPRYNPTRPPGRGSVWQSTWFGIRGSQVQILPPRRGPPDAARPTRPARRGPPDAARPPDRFPQIGSPRRVPADGFRQTGSRPEAATASGCFGRIFSRPFPPGNWAVISALTHGSKRVYFGAPAGDDSSRRVPFFLPLLLDFPKSGVMKLARMFAPSAPAHFSVTVRSEPHTAGFLPLDPVAHILAARLAGAGTRR